METLIPLTEEDIYPYLRNINKDVAVRIFKNNMWFAGYLYNLTLKSECRIHVEPLVKFIPHEPNGIPSAVNGTLINEHDSLIAKSYSDRTLPFLPLVNPHKVIDDSQSDSRLTILFDDGVIILSINDDDKKSVARLLTEATNRID